MGFRRHLFLKRGVPGGSRGRLSQKGTPGLSPCPHPLRDPGVRRVGRLLHHTRHLPNSNWSSKGVRIPPMYALHAQMWGQCSLFPSPSYYCRPIAPPLAKSHTHTHTRHVHSTSTRVHTHTHMHTSPGIWGGPPEGLT